MATNFVSVEKKCEDCGCPSGEQLTYRVESKKCLCDKCAEKNLLDADAPTKWKCEVHKAKLVEAYCEPCKKSVCVTCITTTHQGHRIIDIAEALKQKHDLLRKQFEKIGEREADLSNFETQVRKCISDTEKVFKGIEDEISAAAEEDSRQVDNKREAAGDEINRQADEKIKQINEWRDAQLRDKREEAEEMHKQITGQERSLRDKLFRISQPITEKLTKLQTDVTVALDSLKKSRDKTETVIISDKREQVEKADSICELVSRGLPGSFNTQMIDSISANAHVVKFERRRERQRVGDVVYQWPLDLEAIKISNPSIERICFDYIGNDEVVGWRCFASALPSFSYWTVDINTGNKRQVSMSDQTRITSCRSLDDNTFVCGEANKECVSLFSKQWKHQRDIPLPGALNYYPSVHEVVGKDGMILATRRDDSNIYVIDPVNGKHVRTISLGGKKVKGKIHVTPSGFIVVKTGRTEFTVIDESGTVRKTISDNEWWFGSRFTVDTDDDLLYVMYNVQQDKVTRVDAVTFGLNGDVTRTTIIEIKPSLPFDRSLAMCSGGRLAVGGNGTLRVYKNPSYFPFHSITLLQKYGIAYSRNLQKETEIIFV